MDLGLKGKNILIVGASKGIGKAVAEGFAKEKANIVLISRSEDLLNELCECCLELGAPSVKAYAVDVLSIDLAKFTKDLLKENGVFDIVIQNVGSSLTSRDICGGEKAWHEALRLNALHAIEMNSVIIPEMIAKNIKGHIIHTSSISAEMLRGNPLYASSKAFLNAYVTTAGRELAPKGIYLNSVMPGAVAFPGSYWDIKEQNNDPAVKDFLKHHQAINRFGKPEEVANLVLFLASDKSSFICASNIPVDGGNM